MPKLIDKDENELLNLQMSTDEHWTGKYWIDGKKIYKKIITWDWLKKQMTWNSLKSKFKWSDLIG